MPDERKIILSKIDKPNGKVPFGKEINFCLLNQPGKSGLNKKAQANEITKFLGKNTR